MWSQTSKKLYQTDTVFTAFTLFIRIWYNSMYLISHWAYFPFSLSSFGERKMPSKKYPQAVFANCHFTKVTIASDSFQHKNAITFGKRRRQEKHSWCVIKAWRKTQFENIWHGGLGQTAASWQIWVTFSDPYKVLEGILSTWIHSHSLLHREGIKTFLGPSFK